MRRTTALLVSMLAALGLGAGMTAPAQASGGRVQPLERAHAHNDYEHDRPLFDALQHGFTSVEADVWLVDGELRVAHDLGDAQPGRTLQSLYLRPLTRQVKANHGSVYPRWRGEFQLLIDIKSDGPSTYAAIHDALRDYRKMLTRWVGGKHRAAVQAVISGNRPLEDMLGQRVRYAGYDGRLTDLGGPLKANVMPLVSDNWTVHFTWQGDGPMPAAERDKLRGIVRQAHAAGQRIRFWATPDLAVAQREAVWRELIAAGVDHLNTDDLPGLRDFLRAQDPDE